MFVVISHNRDMHVSYFASTCRTGRWRSEWTFKLVGQKSMEFSVHGVIKVQVCEYLCLDCKLGSTVFIVWNLVKTDMAFKFSIID